LVLLSSFIHYPLTVLISCSIPFLTHTQPFPTMTHFNLQTVTACTSETLKPTYQTVRCHNPEKIFTTMKRSNLKQYEPVL
jgi:hypothetical protein